MYAIGGSANPTILSEGNFYVAPNDPSAKQVEIVASNDPTIGSCAPNYSPSQSLSVAPTYMVPAITLNAGPINCIVGRTLVRKAIMRLIFSFNELEIKYNPTSHKYAKWEAKRPM
ncbi:unnamed protein product [Sphenostylis stenocarpa]|uniref:Uncharacterized protein n=1 Tax=Sphenostylis stenocarpa TaxID=92480 RepID=A0AA86TET9_9FABA|nr:unnamed protein product [Sphenostylis stenocarpa]